MNHKIEQILQGKTANFLYPFLWPDEDHPEAILSEIDAIEKSGCRGFCLEARPFEHFGEEPWWKQARLALEEARRRGMKVWILDDKHFPTGMANEWIEKKCPEHRRHWLKEHHADVYGPLKDASLLLPQLQPDERFLGAVAYRRTAHDEALTGQPLVLTISEGASRLDLNVPEGLWRIFILIDSAHDENHQQAWYIDMLSPESVQVLIDAVYEEHYMNLSEFFGTTLEGFFSDEPGFLAEHLGRMHKDENCYGRTVGQPGVFLPWNETVLKQMASALSDPDASDASKASPAGCAAVLASLPDLWYPHEDIAPQTRLNYMNAVTRLWEENFSFGLGNWCRSHGLLYVGHIIEDMNAHARLGCSGGHYFRSLRGQSLAGIDIVLHQVIPGMSDHITAASVEGEMVDGHFFHYTLANLASSLARITPHMQGRAMCELFGAFGWAESTPFMKWMADFLMIRGINRFVPHAFSVKHPFIDCPPHFYAHGENPQFSGFRVLMNYMNQVTALLDGTVRSCPGAIFYFAENEWMNGFGVMTDDPAGKALYDAHIDYDILPLDALKEAVFENGQLIINGLAHTFFVVPQAPRYPQELVDLTVKMQQADIPVFTLCDPRGGCVLGEAVSEKDLADRVLSAGLVWDYQLSPSKLRVARFDAPDHTGSVFYLFNEDPVQTADPTLRLPLSGNCTKLHLLNEQISAEAIRDGQVSISLLPGESILLCFDSEAELTAPAANLPSAASKAALSKAAPVLLQILENKWSIALRQTGLEEEFQAYKQDAPLENITALNHRPDFSGMIRYTQTFDWKEDAVKALSASDGSAAPVLLDLGEAGFTASIKLNGICFPERIHAPYCWDVSRALIPGSNQLEVYVENTMTNRIYDSFSTYMVIGPSGLQGPVRLTAM